MAPTLHYTLQIVISPTVRIPIIAYVSSLNATVSSKRNIVLLDPKNNCNETVINFRTACKIAVVRASLSQSNQ